MIFLEKRKNKKEFNYSRLLVAFFAVIFIFSLFTTITSANTKPFKINDVSIIEKSGGVSGDISSFSDNEIQNTIVFHKLGDYVIYKLNIQSRVQETITLQQISDINENPYIRLEYDKHNNESLDFESTFDLIIKATYVNELTDVSARNQNTNIRLLIEFLADGAEEEGEIIVGPVTGDFIYVSYILLAVSAFGLIVCLFLAWRRTGKKTIIPMTILIGSLALIPATVKALASVDSIDFVTQFKIYDKQVVKYIIEGEEKTLVTPYGNAITGLETPAKEGYTFSGWKNEDGTDFDPTAPITSDMKIFASFVLEQYSISYNLNGGTVEQDSPTSYTILDDFTLANPTKDHYIFDGWTGTDLNTPTKNVSINHSTGARSYTAIFTPITYTITYDGLTDEEKESLNNPTEYNIESIRFSLKSPQDRLDEANSARYSFAGWKDGETISSAIVLPNTNSMGNKTFVAQWTKIVDDVYTINYILNGGTTSEANPIEFTKNTESFTLHNPSKTGYTFRGWSGTDLVGVDNNEVRVEKGTAKNLEFEANYTANEYQIIFNKRYSSAEGTMPNQIMTYDVASYLPANTYVRKGYTFAGWNTKANGSGTSYSDGVSVKNLAESGEVTLYAQWSANPYTISFNSNAPTGTTATGTMEAMNMTYGTSKMLTLNTFSIPGYNFSGWNTKADGSGTSYSDGASVKNLIASGEKVLYAQWSVEGTNVAYTVVHKRMDLNGSYTIIETDTFYGETSSTITPDTKDYIGFTSPNVKEITILGDGSASIEYLYSRNKYQLTINNTDFVEEGDISGEYYYEEVISINAINRDGYSFEGWSIEPSDTNVIINEQSVEATIGTSNVTLTPIYNANTYTISLSKQGGSGGRSKIYEKYEIGYCISIACSSTITSVSTPSKEGYGFQGYYSKKNGKGIQYIDSDGNLTSNATNTTFSANTTLYASYVANNYTIIFNNNAPAESSVEEETSSMLMVYDTAANLNANNFSVTGYNFIRWNTEKDGSGTDYGDGDSVINLTNIDDGTITLYAQWEIKTATVTVKNGSATTSQQYNYGSEVNIEASDRVGYSFTRWNVSPSNTINEVNGKNIRITVGESDIVLVAVYSIINRSITYGLNGGTNASTNVLSCTIESSAITLANPAKDHYDFAGWSGTDINGLSKNVTIPAHGCTKDFTFTANWEAKSYSVRFMKNGGTGIMNNQVITFDTKVHLNKNNFRREGYTFVDWATEENGGGTRYVDEALIEENMTDTDDDIIVLYAQWSHNQSSVSIPNEYKQFIEGNDPSGIYNYGQQVTVTAKERAGYSFAGWRVRPSDTSSYTSGNSMTVTVSNNNITLEPIYNLIEHSITYNLNGGTNASTNVLSCTIESSAITLANPAKDHYDFAGWSGTDINGLSKNVTIPAHGCTKDFTFTANWLYTVIFKSNGGTGDDIEQVIGYNVTTELRANTFSRTGYTFEGWSTKSDGENGTSYSNRQSVKNLGNITFYAQWKAKKATVTIRNGNGTVSQDHDYGSEVNIEASDRVGYSFTRWNVSPSNTINEVNGKNIRITVGESDIVLVAVYSIINRSITYGLNGGTNASTNVLSCTIESSAITLANPAKDHYDFAGWSGTDINGLSKNVTIPAHGCTKDFTFTANWEAAKYTVVLIPGDDNTSREITGLSYDGTVTLEHDVTKNGYTLRGWQASGDTDIYENGANVAISDLIGFANENNVIQLYAKWDAIEYTIKFSGVKPNECTYITPVYYGDNVTISCNASKGGAIFMGWNTRGDGSGANYNNGSDVSVSDLVSSATSSNDIILYAQWNESIVNTYFLNTQGGKYSSNQSVLMILKDGTTIMVDTSDNEENIVKIVKETLDEDPYYTKSNYQIDHLIISHAHGDHYGALYVLQKDIAINNIYYKETDAYSNDHPGRSSTISSDISNYVHIYDGVNNKYKSLSDIIDNINATNKESISSNDTFMEISVNSNNTKLYLSNLKDNFSGKTCSTIRAKNATVTRASYNNGSFACNGAYICAQDYFSGNYNNIKQATASDGTNNNLWKYSLDDNNIRYTGCGQKTYARNNDGTDDPDITTTRTYNYLCYEETTDKVSIAKDKVCNENTNSISLLVEANTNNGKKYIYIPSDIENNGYSPAGESMLNNSYTTNWYNYPNGEIYGKMNALLINDNFVGGKETNGIIAAAAESRNANDICYKITGVRCNNNGLERSKLDGLVIYQVSHHGNNNAIDANEALGFNERNSKLYAIYTIAKKSSEIKYSGSADVLRTYANLTEYGNIIQLSSYQNNYNSSSKNIGVACHIYQYGDYDCMEKEDGAWVEK